MQTNNISWLLVGDVGLRKFIAQQVDRLDDIISYETEIKPLKKEDSITLINKRVNFYKINPNAQLPIDEDVFLYLFNLTNGRLRYVFGLIKRLLNELSIGDLVDKLTLSLAKPMVVRLARDRLAKNGLTSSEEDVLRELVKLGSASATVLSEAMDKSRQYISRMLVKLSEIKLLEVKREGRNRVYLPVLDVIIAYSKEK